MIGLNTHSVEWIENVRAKLGRRGDKKLIEKVICALILLERIQGHGLKLIFKGGTSILLTMKEPVRFSIDIDIIPDRPEEELLSVLDDISGGKPFHSFKKDNERKSSKDAPVGHYKFYYTSLIDGKEEPILLDVLFESSPYPQVREIPIAHPWLIQEGSALSVTVPSYESILGDKLTAFAPNTTGILYAKERPVEIIKQLFDIALLFDSSTDFETVRASFRKIANIEIEYRQLGITWEDVLDDTLATCIELANRNEKSPQFKELQKGIRNIVNFVIPRFHLDEAIIASAKVAFLTQFLKTDLKSDAPRYSSPTQVSELEIEGAEYSKVYRLKRTNPEAYFYWHHAIGLK